ncbi:MAG TPA: MBL fold metallo-hydrolase [Anaerolineae bacterium]|nr:MBL fold metallo-hydrolase [Anaerolineae bacterium]
MNEQRNGCVGHTFVRIISVFIILQMILIGTSAWAQDNKRDLIITTLYDNSSSNKELKTGLGYSCLIQGAEKAILFDIGDSDAVKNMDKLKIKPESIDVLVISHDHYDHIDGLSAFSKRNKHAVIHDVPHDSVKICEDVFTTGAMGTNPREHNPFIMGTVENALIIRTAKGLVIITGCAHPGIVEIVQRAKSLSPKDPVYLVMGGFHLVDENKGSVKKIASDLKNENVQKVAPSHCTGGMAKSVFKDVFGADFIPGDVGKPIIIEGAL